MVNSIPQNRLILYVLLLGLIPPILCGFYFWSQKNNLDLLIERMEQIQESAIQKQIKQATNQAAYETFKNADHFYLDKHLETAVFLKPEIESLQKLMENKNFSGDEALTKRLEKLIGKENKILFAGGQVITYPTFQETLLSLTTPVEINGEDLKMILARIEGVEIGDDVPQDKRPQLIITDFKLEEKTIGKQNEVYLLNMKLLKREYL